MNVEYAAKACLICPSAKAISRLVVLTRYQTVPLPRVSTSAKKGAMRGSSFERGNETVTTVDSSSPSEMAPLVDI